MTSTCSTTIATCCVCVPTQLYTFWNLSNAETHHFTPHLAYTDRLAPTLNVNDLRSTITQLHHLLHDARFDTIHVNLGRSSHDLGYLDCCQGRLIRTSNTHWQQQHLFSSDMIFTATSLRWLISSCQSHRQIFCDRNQ